MAAYACKTSGELNADTAVRTTNARLWGVQVLTDGTNAATLIIYDNASAATGTKLMTIKVPGATLCDSLFFPIPVAASNGLYADITGTGAVFYVYSE